MPKKAAMHATNFPYTESGSLSPYPTVVMVAMHHHIASETELIF